MLILGCAGMAYLRENLETALGVAVVDPAQAAVTMAIGRVLLDLTTRSSKATPVKAAE